MFKKYLKVDEQGYYIDTVLFEYNEGEEIPLPPDEFHIEPSETKYFYLPKYDFENRDWVEGMVREDILINLKNNKFTELSNKCKNDILGYFEASVNNINYLFSFDYEAQQNFTGTLALFTEGVITEMEWTAWKNGVAERIILNKSQFMGVISKAFGHKNEKISKLRNELQPLLDSATTIEEIQNINW